MKKTILVVVTALGIFSSTIAQNVPFYVPTNGLVGWWPFNGNANDESGNGNNGAVNGAILTTDRNSKSNSAYLFNGTTNYISGSISNFTNTTITSLSAWINYTGDAGGKTFDTYFQYGQYGLHTFGYAYNYSGKNLDLHSKCFTITPYVNVDLNNSWHHVVVVDSLTITKIYVDGNLKSVYTTGNASNCYLGSNYFEIGASTSDNQYVTGKLDDIGIWNRALSQQEINNLYNALQCTNPTLTLNLSDSTVAFKQDSVLLDAGAGYTTYSWNTGASTRFIWAKDEMKYKVSVTLGNSCGIDSTVVIFVKGIQQKDTTICAGNSFNLSLQGSFPRNGLIGWWPFNGNANDLSGNGNNGTVNGASLTTDRFGIPNNAYSFDGVNDFIQSDTISALNSSINSISTWIYAPSFSVHHQIEFAAPTFGTLGRAFAFNTGRLAIVPTGNCVAASGAGVVNLSGQLGINSWYHLVFISDGSIGKFYINGVYIGQANIGSTICQNPLTLVLGRGTNGGGPMWYTGKIDDIGIWNRALSEQEITSLYSLSPNVKSKVLWSTNDTINSITVSPTVNTTYTCKQTIGSYSFTDSVKVNIRTLPSKLVNAPKLSLCKNDSILLAAANGYTYQWKRGNTNLAQTRTLNAAEPGAYTITLTDNLGCKNTSDTMRIFNAPLPKPIIVVKDSAQCLRGNVFIFKDSTQLDSGTYSRQWHFGNGATSSVVNPNNSYNSVGMYLVKLISTTNYGCMDSITRQVVVNPNPTAGLMLGDSLNLKTSTPYVYTIAQQLNHSYNWQINNGIVVAGQNTNLATVQWISNGPGSVKVIVTNPQGCTDTTNKIISIGNVGLTEIGNIGALHFYPNPAQNIINLKADSKLIGEVYSIYDNTGRFVLSGKLNDEITTIELGKLSGGIYMFSVGENMKQTFRLIKEQ